MLWTAAAVLTVTLGIGLAATFLVRSVAHRIGLADRPDGHRKLHIRAIPLGGGVAIFVTSVAVLAALTLVENPWQEALQAAMPSLTGVLIGGSIVVITGLLDDSLGIRGHHKLLGQALASFAVLLFSPPIYALQAFGLSIEIGWLAAPLAVLGLTAAINTINLLDGADGLASSLGIIVTGTISAAAFSMGHEEVAIVGLVFVGSLLAFLFFNFPPASIFLGDTGSMLIGLVAGALTLRLCVNDSGAASAPAALALWAVPLLDTGTAILRRTLTGRSIYTTDRGHLHHQLGRRMGNKRALLCIALCVALTAASAALSLVCRNDLLAVFGGTGVIAALIGARIFGHSECQLLLTKAGQFIRTPLRGLLGPARSGASHIRVRLQGTRDWDAAWATLLERAEILQLSEMELDLNIPAIEEGYHAAWRCHDANLADRQWRFDVPLIVGGRPAGHLRLTGLRETCLLESMRQVLEALEISEAAINLLTRSEAAPPPSARPALTSDRLPSASPLLQPTTL